MLKKHVNDVATTNHKKQPSKVVFKSSKESDFMRRLFITKC